MAGALVVVALVTTALVEGWSDAAGVVVVSALLLQPLVTFINNRPKTRETRILFIPQDNPAQPGVHGVNTPTGLRRASPDFIV